MLNTDYKIQAIKVLLNEDCILTRYYPLIPYKNILVEKLSKMGCYTKSDCVNLSDESLLDAGLKAPLLKEVKTHIAVARAFTDVL